MASVDNIIFLSRQHALRALEIDLLGYEIQIDLLRDLCPIITRDRFIIIDPGRTDCQLLSRGKKSKTRTISYEGLVRLLMAHLHENPPSLSVLSEICAMVFQTNCHPLTDPGCDDIRIRIETQMSMFQCRQCGHCCRNLSYQADCTEKDYQRWENLGRNDILEKVSTIAIGSSRSYKIWLKPGTSTFYEQCPWLKPATLTGRFECEIYEIRPALCHQYPLTRKHAAMTGCKGIFGS